MSSVKDFAHDLLQRIIDDWADKVRNPTLFRVLAHNLGRAAAFDLYMPLIGGYHVEAGRSLLNLIHMLANTRYRLLSLPMQILNDITV